MNKIDIILIYLIIIISFVCIIKIYLNNKNIEKFYSFNKQFSGVMRFIDYDNPTRYLGSYPNYWHNCFISDNNICNYDGVEYIYDSSNYKIKINDGDDDDPDKVIDVTNIRLSKGDKGNNGSDATMPPINFYYKNKEDEYINEEDGSIIPVTGEVTHKPFFEVLGDPDKDEIKVYVKRHEDCTQQACEECEGEVNINTITSTTGTDAVNVTGNITTKNIILERLGKICINNENPNNCLDYDDISKLINWSTECKQCVTPQIS
jgi:hypothetical protein